MANVENKTAAVPPVESQQAPKTVAAAVATQSQAQAETGPAEASPCTFPKRSLQCAPGQSNRCRLT